MAALVGLMLGRGAVAEFVSRHDALATWLTVFVAMCLQALPFLVVGVVLSALISVIVPDGLLGRLLPRRPALAVPAAGAWGMALPGCECASVPVSGSLMARGVPASVALTFQLAAPAVNPVVLVSTAVAFGGRADVVLARFVASMLTAVIVGYLWLALGRDDLVRVRERRHGHASTGQALTEEVAHDVLQAGGFLVVGPAVDVKLIAMQAATYGRAFTARFAPLTLVVATGCALLVGSVLS